MEKEPLELEERLKKGKLISIFSCSRQQSCQLNYSEQMLDTGVRTEEFGAKKPPPDK